MRKIKFELDGNLDVLNLEAKENTDIADVREALKAKCAPKLNQFAAVELKLSLTTDGNVVELNPTALHSVIPDGSTVVILHPPYKKESKTEDALLAFLKAEAAKKEVRQQQKDKLAARQRGLVDALAKHANKKAKVDLDCWEHDSLMSLKRDPKFKTSLVEYYGRSASTEKLKCQVLDQEFPSEHVIGSHIWKSETHGDGLEHFGLKKTDIHNNRNGLLMCKGIEEAFDRKQVCFVYDFLHNQLTLFVADQTLLERLVSPSKTIRFLHIDGNVLQCGPNSMPYRRLLSWHAYLTLEKYGFGDNYEYYGKCSEGAPDLEALLSRIRVGAAASEDEGDVTENVEGKTESESSKRDERLH